MSERKNAQTQLAILPALAQRWSPRAFSAREVEEDELDRIMEAARWAPSSNNEQPWRFIIARKGEAHYAPLFEGFNEWNQKWAWTAPVIGVSLAKKNFTKNDKENRHSWHDVGLSMGNLLAQATHEGIYLHQMAGIHPEKITDHFSINTEQFEVVAMFAMGYQDIQRLSELDERYKEPELKERERKPLNEIVFGAGFGDPQTI